VGKRRQVEGKSVGIKSVYASSAEEGGMDRMKDRMREKGNDRFVSVYMPLKGARSIVRKSNLPPRMLLFHFVTEM
jgi:hypothetical protein